MYEAWRWARDSRAAGQALSGVGMSKLILNVLEGPGGGGRRDVI